MPKVRSTRVPFWVGGSPGTSTRKRSSVDVSTLASPLYVGHRSLSALHPEMSMEGYAASAALGYPLEGDVNLLSDGTLVMCHDATVDRTMLQADGVTAATGNVSSFTSAQWAAMKVRPAITGGPVGTPVFLNDLLNLYGGKVPILPEITSAHTSAVISAVSSRNLHKSVIVQSFDSAAVTAVTTAGIEGLYLVGATEVPLATVQATGAKWVGANITPSNAYLASLSAAGIRPLIYTVNDTAVAQAKVAAGAFGVFSDDPQGTAVTGPFVQSKTFDNTGLWPGYRKRVIITGGSGHDVSLDPTGVKARCGGAGYVECRMGWMGPMPNNVRVTATVEYQAESTGQDRFFSLSLIQRADNDAFLDQAVVGQAGYRLAVRRDGRLQMYYVASGALPASQDINTANGAFVAAASTGLITVSFEINATQVKADTNLGGGGAGVHRAINHTLFRGPTFLHFGANGSTAILRNVLVEAL